MLSPPKMPGYKKKKKNPKENNRALRLFGLGPTYWSDHKNSPVSPAVMCDAAKATIHGYIISYTAAHKKALISKRQNTEKQVKRIEHLHSTTPTQINWSVLCHARSKLNLDHTNHIKNYCFFPNRIIMSMQTNLADC